MVRTTPVDRYHHDPMFRQLVDMLYVAVMLAQIKFEELHVRPLILDAGWPGRG